MRAIIKSFELIDHDNWEYWPEQIDDFCVAAEAILSTEESVGGDIFSFEVCTPKWLMKNKKGQPKFIRHILIVNEFDEREIKRALNLLVADQTGSCWEEIASKLARYMFWEYEDYNELTP